MELGLVDERDLLVCRPHHPDVQLALAHVPGEGMSDRHPDVLGRLTIEVAVVQPRSFEGEGAHADRLDLDQAAEVDGVDGTVSVALNQVALVTHRILGVDEALAATELTLLRGGVAPTVAAVLALEVSDE